MADKKDRRVWCVQGGTEDGSGHDLFLTENVVALDEPFLPDLSQIPPARVMTKSPGVPLAGVKLKKIGKMYGKIYEAVKEVGANGPPMGKPALGMHVGHLVRLANVAQQGDLVIYLAEHEEEIVYIGEVFSDYFYVACRYQHRRRVNWYEFSKGKLPQRFGLMKGFTEVKNKELARKITDKWKRGKKVIIFN